MATVFAVVLYFAGLNPLVPLFGLAIAVMLIENRGRVFRQRMPGGSVQAGLLLPIVSFAQVAPAGLASFSPAVLFLTFLNIGATLYGSGYVLHAFLRDDFVNRLGG